jgi:hypothetical protein
MMPARSPGEPREHGESLPLSPRELAIARSVIYASLFEYPLTLDQLRHALIESDQTQAEIYSTYCSSGKLPMIIEYRDGFFFPRGQAALIGRRLQREARSRAFLERHRRLLRFVCALPYTRMVALSGSIAHFNLDGGGDLDLFIVTRGSHVWSVTVAVLVLAKLLRQRRVVCANFVLSDTHLEFAQQDLFTANQVIHLRPLVGASLLGDIVAANPFVARLYPNFRAPGAPGAPGVDVAQSAVVAPGPGLERMKAIVERVCLGPSRLVEVLCRHAYAWHLRRRATTWQSPEQVQQQPDYLKLHTHSHRRSVLERFDLALRDALQRVPCDGQPFAAAAAVPRRRAAHR